MGFLLNGVLESVDNPTQNTGQMTNMIDITEQCNWFHTMSTSMVSLNMKTCQLVEMTEKNFNKSR